jgi:predicted RNase H-like HicB family nuclease
VGQQLVYCHVFGKVGARELQGHMNSGEPAAVHRSNSLSRAPLFAPCGEFRYARLRLRHIMALVMKNITLPIVIEADADGYFVSCPPLQGCYSQGDTYEEAVENIKDAIKLHIADRLSEGEEIPQVSVSLSTVEIAV